MKIYYIGRVRDFRIPRQIGTIDNEHYEFVIISKPDDMAGVINSIIIVGYGKERVIDLKALQRLRALNNIVFRLNN